MKRPIKHYIGRVRVQKQLKIWNYSHNQIALPNKTSYFDEDTIPDICNLTKKLLIIFKQKAASLGH